MKPIIRLEKPEDHAAVHVVEVAAFDREGEADLVDRLRSENAVIFSLVAQNENGICGHLLFSPVRLNPPCAGVQIAGLGPVAVLPELQGQGIGKMLIEYGLALLKNTDWDAVVLLGDPAYYSRFGFKPAYEFNLACTYPVQPEDFQVLELNPTALSKCEGIIHYHPVFDEVT